VTFDTWESYFYPETIDPVTGVGTLRNILGEHDGAALARREYVRTSARAEQLLRGEVAIPKTYDGEHLRAIHRYLFQDVYSWAGEYRTVNIFKGTPRGFADITTGEVDRYLSEVHELVTGEQWGRLDHEEFAGRAARVFAYVNQAHPFREGNGRTSKVFMEHVAEQSGFTLDFARVDPEVWNNASMLSGPDLGKHPPVPDSLVPVFQAVTVERRSGGVDKGDDQRH